MSNKHWAQRLRLKHLHFLITLAETGSLTDTARISHTTQPGLSRWLKELEDDIGGSLFERHSRGLVPTPLGEMFIHHARRITTEMERAQHNLEDFEEGSTQSIAIGTSPATSPDFVPQAVMNFLKIHPGARIEIHESTMDSLIKKLELGKLDVVVGRFDNFAPQENLHNEMLYVEKLRVIARKDHPLTKKKTLQWEDLYQYSWIVWPHGAPIRTKLDIALTRAGRKPLPYRIESSSQVGNLWFLNNSDMLSVGSERVAKQFHERGLISILDLEIESDSTPGTVGMCWRDEQHPDTSTQQFLDFLRDSAHLS